MKKFLLLIVFIFITTILIVIIKPELHKPINFADLNFVLDNNFSETIENVNIVEQQNLSNKNNINLNQVSVGKDVAVQTGSNVEQFKALDVKLATNEDADKRLESLVKLHDNLQNNKKELKTIEKNAHQDSTSFYSTTPEQIVQADTDRDVILWNKWRAKARNKIDKKLNKTYFFVETTDGIYSTDSINNFPKNSVFSMKARVHSDGQIDNIISFIIKEKDLKFRGTQVLVTKGSEIHVYFYDSDSYFKLFFMGTEFNLNKEKELNEGEDLKRILSESKKTNLYNYVDSDRVYLRNMSEKLKNLSKEKFLRFPENSRRTSVDIYYGITDIVRINTIKEATENMYNDIEK